MATKSVYSSLTLLELAKRINPDGSIAQIAEVLTQTNEILRDAIALEANDRTSHLVTMRSKLPTGTWRKINSGVNPESSKTTQVREAIGMLEARSVIDEKLVKLSPNPAQFRSIEDMSFIMGMSETFAETLMYGNKDTDPTQFDGFLPRYDSTTGDNKDFIWNAGGSGSDLASVLVCSWSPQTCHLVYPMGMGYGSTTINGNVGVGITRTDRGLQQVQDDAGRTFDAYVTKFELNIGLAIRDPRAVQRIVNIETDGTTNTLDDDLLIKAINRCRGMNKVIYMNEVLKSQLDILAKDKTNVNYTMGEEFGMPVTYFRGVPVRQVDALLNTESTVA